jgi:hypothetical protein
MGSGQGMPMPALNLPHNDTEDGTDTPSGNSKSGKKGGSGSPSGANSSNSSSDSNGDSGGSANPYDFANGSASSDDSSPPTGQKRFDTPGKSYAQASPRKKFTFDDSPDYDSSQTHSADRAEDSRKSLAQKRGKNWGLKTSRSGTPVTRPLHVQCYADKLVVRGEPGDVVGDKTIALGSYTQDSVDDLVATIGKRIERWGIAGQGMFWRPQLIVDVSPGAEARFDDLKALLDNSGLEVLGRGSVVGAPGGPIGPAANNPANMLRR